MRSNDVGNVHYKVALALLRGGKTFHGHVEIKFNLYKDIPMHDVFVDYKGSKVLKLVVNGEHVKTGTPFRDHKIIFPIKLLQPDENIV